MRHSQFVCSPNVRQAGFQSSLWNDVQATSARFREHTKTLSRINKPHADKHYDLLSLRSAELLRQIQKKISQRFEYYYKRGSTGLTPPHTIPDAAKGPIPSPSIWANLCLHSC